MPWRIEFTPQAAKALRKLDRPSRQKVIGYLDALLESCSSPPDRGKGLTAHLSSFWRYRLGDLRLIWWIGWVEEVPGVNAQERTREGLVISLKAVLQEALEMNRDEAAAPSCAKAHAALQQQQLAGAGEDQCLLVPEPFLWPVEVLMGPSAGTLGHAFERLLGLIVPG